MSTAVMLERMAEASPRFKARIAGVFYLLTFVTGMFALVLVNGRHVANLAGTACYVAVILLFYHLFKAVNRSVSLLAACLGLVGCAVGALSSFHLAPLRINSLVFFGFYCPLIGYLIFRSIFPPRILGVLMMFAGLGWLTFVSARVATYLSPYNMLPGIVGEGALTLWLLAMGVNGERWKKQSEVIGRRG